MRTAYDSIAKDLPASLVTALLSARLEAIDRQCHVAQSRTVARRTFRNLKDDIKLFLSYQDTLTCVDYQVCVIVAITSTLGTVDSILEELQLTLSKLESEMRQ